LIFKTLFSLKVNRYDISVTRVTARVTQLHKTTSLQQLVCLVWFLIQATINKHGGEGASFAPLKIIVEVALYLTGDYLFV
jgi:hypothetical protein